MGRSAAEMVATCPFTTTRVATSLRTGRSSAPQGKAPQLYLQLETTAIRDVVSSFLIECIVRRLMKVDLDSANPRPLTDRILQNNAAESIEACAKYCTGYTYFGMEYGQEVSFLSFQRRIDI